MTNQFWRDQAACAEVDPTLWDTDTPAGNERAIRICQACPVRLDCDREATKRGEQWGIWGGIDRRKATVPYGTQKELARRQRIAEATQKRRATFAQAAKKAIRTGTTIKAFADSRGLKPASVIARLRVAERADLIDQWRQAEKGVRHAEAQQILNQLAADPTTVTAHRRYALEMNT